MTHKKTSSESTGTIRSAGKPGSTPAEVLAGLSRSFVEHNPEPAYMDREDSLLSYRSYYHPLSCAKGKLLAEEALSFPDLPFFRKDRTLGPFRIADWGTGTGGFAEGVLQAILPRLGPDIPVEAFLVDRSAPALSLARETLGQLLGARGTLYTQCLRLPAIPEMPGSLDILLLANVLAEDPQRADSFVSLLGKGLRRLADGGLLILAEPADRLSSRTLLSVRDALISSFPGLFRILSPCPNGQDAPCPALRDERDWCHEDRAFIFSREILELSRTVGHVRDALKMTYLIAQKTAQPSPPPTGTPDRTALRLVSELKKERGMAWGIFCDGRERHRIRLLLRHKNDKNRLFLELSRGDGIWAHPPGNLPRRGPFLDLSSEDRIERIDPLTSPATGNG